MRTKTNIPAQSSVTQDVSFNEKAILDVLMPEQKPTPEAIHPTDAVNRQFVEGRLTSTFAGLIGPAEDGSYADGLFTDFSATDTPIGTAVDRFNEVLKGLAPNPAPNLTTIAPTVTGTAGKLSFGASNGITGYTNVPALDIGGTFPVSGTKNGIFNANTTITGNIASGVNPNFTNSRPYPNKAFGNGNEGTLQLVVNGAVIHTVDLTTFASGSNLNATGSGFNLSAANSVQFDNGQVLDIFKYRTGTFLISAADQRPGYNVALVRHFVNAANRDTNVTEWVVDNALDATGFSGESLTNMVLSGSRKISGVTYHTGGTVDYAVVIANAYKNTHSASASALTYSGTNAASFAEPLPAVIDETTDISIAAKQVSINTSNRLLNNSLQVKLTVDRVVQGDLTSTGSNYNNILIDATADDSTNTSETFNGENFRVHAGVNVSSASYGSGGAGASGATWDSAQSLILGNANHNTGLLVSGGKLSYPSNTSHIANIFNGDFSAVINGPAGNPTYQTASGERTFLRYFYSALSYSNFRLNLSVASTSFVKKSVPLSGNNLHLEILAPNVTVNSSGVVEWKDAVEPHNGDDEAIGCYAGTFGDTIPTNWGVTLGTKNTASSGHVVLVKITAPSSWSGNIDAMTLTWI
jgi:small nuclear ribonucleoprotein (snRNP)-like protein